MIIKKLTNIPLKDNKTGVTRGRRCNLITIYCPVCERFHMLERKDIALVEHEDKQVLVCYESVKNI